MLLALVRRAESVTLEIVELGTGRKLPAVIRHNDPILFGRLGRLGSARATHMGGVDRPIGARGFGDPLESCSSLATSHTLLPTRQRWLCCRGRGPRSVPTFPRAVLER